MNFYPANVDIEALNTLGKKAFPKFNDNHLLRILDVITQKYYYYNYKEDFSYVKIHSDLFGSITNDYVKYIKLVFENEIIIIDEDWQKDVKSKGYSFTSKYLQGLTFIDTIDRKNKISCEKFFNEEYDIDKYKENIKSNSSFFNFESKDILDSFLPFLKIDTEKALSISEGLYQKDINDTQLINEENLKDKIDLASARKNRRFMSIHKLRKRVFNTSRPDSIGRYFNPLTSLKKELRSTLSVNNQNLVGLDLRNSQPFLASVIFSPSFWYFDALPANIKFKFERKFNIKSSETCKFNIETIGMHEQILNFVNYDRLIKALVKLNAPLSDSLKYKELVANNKFYDKLEDLIKGECGIANLPAKDLSFIIMFSSNRTGIKDHKKTRQIPPKQKRMAKKIFNDAFPDVNEIFKTIKSKNHSTLARLLQRIESFLFIDQIVYEINKRCPHLPIFTIHDSICMPGGIPKNIEDMASKFIEDAIGLKPMFKIEKYALEEELSNIDV